MEKDLRTFLIIGAILGGIASLISVITYIERKQCEAKL